MKVRTNVLSAPSGYIYDCFMMTKNPKFEEVYGIYMQEVINARELKKPYIDRTGRIHVHWTKKVHMHRSNELAQEAIDILQEILSQ